MSPIIQPGDEARAEDVLDELQSVLKKRGCLLIHKPDCMVLAVCDPVLGSLGECRAIAQVEVIAPERYRWREVQWPNREPS